MAGRGLEALTVPHHPKSMGGADWRFRNDRYQRLVEICSMWDIAEEAGPLSVQTALAMGHRLGFVGGTDSHYGLANQGSFHVNDGNGARLRGGAGTDARGHLAGALRPPLLRYHRRPHSARLHP